MPDASNPFLKYVSPSQAPAPDSTPAPDAPPTENQAPASAPNPFLKYVTPSAAQTSTPLAQAQPGAGVMDEINRRVGEFGTGAYKGLANLIGGPGEIGRASAEMNKNAIVPDPLAALKYLPSQEDVRSFFFNKMGVPEVKPTDIAGRALANVGEAAGSAPFPGAALMDIGSGLGRTGGEQAASGTPYEKIAGILGGIVGGAIPGLYQMWRSTPAEMLARSTEGMTPEEWAAAAERQRVAAEQGTPLLASEATNNPTLNKLAADTAASRGGGPTMQRFLAQRPQQTAALAQQHLESIGPAQIPEDVARRVQQAATETIQNAQGARTAAASPFYQAASSTPLPKSSVQFITDQIDALTQNAPQDVAAGLQALKQRIIANPTVGAVSGEVKLLREATNPQALGATLAEKATAARATPVARAAETEMEAESPMYAAGQATYRAQSPQVQALQQGDIGRLSSPTPEEIANVGGKLNQQARVIFNPETARPQTIRNVARSLQSTDPEAFRDLTRTYLENTFDKAFKDAVTGPNQLSPVNWRNAIAGTNQQRQNLDTVLEEVARTNGGNPAVLKRGFNRMLDTFAQMGKSSGTASQAVRGEAAAEAGLGGATRAITAPLKTIQDTFLNMLQRGNFAKLADVFTSPDGIKIIRQMAITAPNSARANLLASQIMNLSRPDQSTPSGQ